jgi:RNA polymerase sigma-70 factor (ECF subfamily)
MRLAFDDERARTMMGPAEDGDRLVAGARAGSRESLGRALEDCRRYLLAIAERQLDPDLRAKGSASDLVQETFLEAQRDFARFQGSSPDELRAWLRQVLLHNVGAFTHRFRSTSKRTVEREVALAACGASTDLGADLAGSALTPSGVAIEHEQAMALRRALERLPEEYRRVVVLRFEEGRSFEEIGRLTGRSPDAARKVWSRAMERLRQEWEGLS